MSAEIPVQAMVWDCHQIKHCLHEKWFYKLHVINGRHLQTAISGFTFVGKVENIHVINIIHSYTGLSILLAWDASLTE